jgi:hypothetical protein
MKRLLAIQQELKAPKNQWNKFGNYSYRNLEDILEAVKPLCDKHGVVLILSDKVISVGDKNYVEVTSTLYDLSGKVIAQSTASAREATTQKGMNDAQITGSSSSYAGKYSVSKMFLIDDTKDADTNEFKNQSDNTPAPKNKQIDIEDQIKETFETKPLTDEANACKTMDELAKWYTGLPDHMRREGSPAVAVKDARKAEIMENDKFISTTKGKVPYSELPDFMSLKKLTVDQLHGVCQKYDMMGYTKLTKEKLIVFIIDQITKLKERNA